MSPGAVTAAGHTRGSRSRAAAATPRRRVATERPAPVHPRRVSGPATGRVAAPAERPASGAGARLLLVVRSLPDHSLLDRIVRGRVWIPLLGILLAGIVATQVEVLRLNASMGRALKQSSSLAIRNQALQTSVAELSDDARIERLAARMGMVMPDPTVLSFVPSSADPMRAIRNIHSPSSDQFVSQLPSPSSADSAGASSGSSSVASSGSASSFSGGGSSGTSADSVSGAASGSSSGSDSSSSVGSSASSGGTSGSGSSVTDSSGSGSSSTDSSSTGGSGSTDASASGGSSSAGGSSGG